MIEYPAIFLLQWLPLYFWPSNHQHSQFKKEPLVWEDQQTQFKDRIKISFFGDMMTMKDGVAPTADQKLRDIFLSSDIILGNCEFPVSNDSKPTKDFFVYSAPKRFVKDFLNNLSIDPSKLYFSLANNHIGDQGAEGLLDSIAELKSLGIHPIGAMSSSSTPLFQLEVKGKKIGILAWTHWLNKHVFLNDSGVYRTNLIKEYFANKDLKPHVDYLISFPHWEFEFRHYPIQETRNFANTLFNSGVNLVVGHHPHVLQPIENINGQFSFYSLGNLNGPSFPVMGWPIKLGAILQVELGITEDGKLKLAKYELTPFTQEKIKDNIHLKALDMNDSKNYLKFIQRIKELFPTP